MLRRYATLQTQHRHPNLTDSETESDDRSELVSNNIIGKNGYKKSSGGGVNVGTTGAGTGRERHQNKRRKEKSNDVHGDDHDIKPDEESHHKMIRKAEKYQEYMKMIPIPSSSSTSSSRESPIIPFVTWEGLAKSMYQVHKQPLHYLTHRLLKQWDQSRVGSPEETKRLDLILHPTTAEATLWGIEEFHRLCSSHHYLAKLWLSDPHYYEIVDPVIP